MPMLTTMRGFTLIEAMVTLAIVAVIASIALPNFTTVIANAQIRSTADQLRDLAGRARQEAVKRNVPVALTAAGNVVTLAVPAFGASPALKLTQFVSKSTISDGVVTLTGSGRATAAASFTVTSDKLACKAADGPLTCYTVQVFTGGATRMCNPALAKGSPAACK